MSGCVHSDEKKPSAVKPRPAVMSRPTVKPRRAGTSAFVLERSHPICAFLYLVSVMGITVFTRNPVLLLQSLVGAVMLAALCGKLRKAGWLLLMAAAAALSNPLFSRSGVTILFFVGDAAFTLEALLYGAAFGVMLAAAVLWGSCASVFMTSDKYIWLFGRILPSAGLILSCSLRFVPLFVRRTGDFVKSRGADSVSGYIRAFTASVSYSAEEAMQISDSMKARGYASGRRTFYSPHRFAGRDFGALCLTLLCAGGTAALLVCGADGFLYYPAISPLRFSAASCVMYALFGVLCLLPSAAVCGERMRRFSCANQLRLL